MSEPNTKENVFDVFLCHHSIDKPAIRDITQKLKEKGIRPWLDEEQIRPGASWQKAIGDQIHDIRSAAVFVGESGLGPWQDQEIQALLSQFVNRNCPVIPVVLPSAKETPKLPWTLENINWVDFRVKYPAPFKQLIWGITGKKPDDAFKDSSASNPYIPSKKDLFPPQKKKVIELCLPGDLNEFSNEAKMVLLESINRLMDIGEVKLTRAVAGSIRLYLELDTEDADKLYSAFKEGQLTDLGISEARLYPAIAIPPEGEQRYQLQILLDLVNEYWIEGVFKHSLYNEVLISLGKRAMDEAVEPPWRQFVELPSQRSNLILKDCNIKSIFDASGLLLILGEPGSGKTTTLLELASELIARGKSDSKERVPIVLNLSSWKKNQPLNDWIVEELSSKYRIPVKIGHAWLKNDYLLPLLDGLDEVQNALRPGCVARINEFIEKFQPSGLVVCCRLMEYQWLPERLKLNGAICLELLDVKGVNEFLNKGGPKLTVLRQAMSNDSTLQELAQSPLMLSIMCLAYEGVGREDLAKQEIVSTEERREHIFNVYIDRMFQRKQSTTNLFSKDKVINWLSWLAKGMKKHSQTIFFMEGLQPTWLETRVQRLIYGAVAALLIAIISGMMVGTIEGLRAGLGIGLFGMIANGFSVLIGIGLGCWSVSSIKCGFISGLIGGLIYSLIFGLIHILIFMLNIGLISELYLELINLLNIGLVGGLLVGLIGGVGVGTMKVISPIEALGWHWKRFWKKTHEGMKLIAPICGIIIALASGLLVGFYQRKWWDALISGLIFVPITMLASAAISGVIGGMTATVKPSKTSANQGIKSSMKHAVISLLVIAMIFGIAGILVGWWIEERQFSLNRLMVWQHHLILSGFAVGLIAGLIGSLNLGGSAVIKHYSLRFMLWIKGYTPFKFIEFLDYCAKLILLKKVGGGYIFIHRMVQEHFASMEAKTTRTGLGKVETSR